MREHEEIESYQEAPPFSGLISLLIVLGLAGTAYLISSIDNPLMKNLAPVLAACLAGGLYRLITRLF